MSFFRDQYIILKRKPNKLQLDVFFELIVNKIEACDHLIEKMQSEIDQLKADREQERKPMFEVLQGAHNGESKNGN